MSVRVMAWVYDHAPDDLKPSEMLTLLVLADHANDDGGLAYPSIKTLMRKTRLGERTVQAALKSLIKSKVIRLQMSANGPRPDVYCFPAFRGAEFAGVNGRHDTLTPAKNDTLPPQIFPKNGATPIKENHPIEPSLSLTVADAPATPPKRCKKMPLPEKWDEEQNFQGPDGLYAWADRMLGLKVERVDFETDKFMDYWKNGDWKCDWLATWRNWMRDASQRKAGAYR